MRALTITSVGRTLATFVHTVEPLVPWPLSFIQRCTALFGEYYFSKVSLGCLCVCRAHLDKLLEYCQNGVDEGATLVYGGKRVDRTGACTGGGTEQVRVCVEREEGGGHVQTKGGGGALMLCGERGFI